MSCSISITQAAILLSLSLLLDSWLARSALDSLWLSVAVHYSRNPGAHRYEEISSNGTKTPSETRKLKACLKRLWLCCIIRDRMISLTSYRPFCLTSSNADLRAKVMLKSTDLCGEVNESHVYDLVTKLILAEILTKFVELCVILTEILTLASLMHGTGLKASSTSPINESRIKHCKTQLQQWCRILSQMQWEADMDASSNPKSGTPAAFNVVLYKNVLNIYYQ